MKQNFLTIFKPASNRIAILDGFRSVSFLMVFLHHLLLIAVILPNSIDVTKNLMMELPWYLYWIFHLDKALDIFFVLSGFLIGKMLFREYKLTDRLCLKRFYFRRALRIIPAYYFMLLVALVVLSLSAPDAINTPLFMGHFLFLNNMMPHLDSPVGWAWSLAVEEQFYVVFPLFLIFIFFKTSYKITSLIAFLVFSAAIRLLYLYTHPELYQMLGVEVFFDFEKFGALFYDGLYVNLYTRFGGFVVGILLAYLVVFKEIELTSFFADNARFIKYLKSIFILILLLICLYPSHNFALLGEEMQWVNFLYMALHRHIFSIALGGLMAIMLYGRGRDVLKDSLELRVWYPIAQTSYSAYLFHCFFIFIVVQLTVNSAPNLQSLGFIGYLCKIGGISLLITWCFSVAVFCCVEKPFMNFRGNSIRSD